MCFLQRQRRYYKQVKSMMCSYNAVNGVPSCANGKFQNDLVREQWGWDGFIVSDCGVSSALVCLKRRDPDEPPMTKMYVLLPHPRVACTETPATGAHYNSVPLRYTQL